MREYKLYRKYQECRQRYLHKSITKAKAEDWIRMDATEKYLFEQALKLLERNSDYFKFFIPTRKLQGKEVKQLKINHNKIVL